LQLILSPSVKLADDADSAVTIISDYLNASKEFSAGLIDFKIQRFGSDNIALFCKYGSQAHMALGQSAINGLSSSIGWAVRE
jgi:hypothetical protein